MSTAPPDADRAFLATLKLLYVEDDDDTRAQLHKFLARRVGEVLEARDGAEGLQRWREQRPDLVLTDLQMPRMDGLSMVAEIRRAGGHLPILVSTAFEEVAYLRRAIELGIERYVTKPVDGPALDSLLLSVARRLRAERALEREHQRELEELQRHHLASMGVMAGGMAHDFNNLLQGIHGSVTLARESLEPDTEAHELLGIASEGAEQAARLSAELLMLAQGSVKLVPTSIGPLLERALRNGTRGSDVEVHLAGVATLPTIDAAPSLLERAFLELARNAVEAMAGRGCLHVTPRIVSLEAPLGPNLPRGDFLELSFRDEGPGIDPALLGSLFEPYVSSKPRSSVKGMGLGLAVCRGILLKHHGDVIADSPPGQGATFRVHLPLRRAGD